jgi:hypothetical protein
MFAGQFCKFRVAMRKVQAVCRWSVNADKPFRFRANPCQTCGETKKLGIITGFSASTSVSLVSITPTLSIYIFILIFVLPEGKSGKVCGSLSKKSYFGNRLTHGKKIYPLMLQTLSLFKRLLTAFPCVYLGLIPERVHMRILVNKASAGKIFSEYFGPSLSLSFH